MGMKLFDDHIPRLVERSNEFAVGVRMPTAAQVRDMLNVAFVSSLLREEGIPVAVSLAFADRTDGHSRGIPAFADPTPLTPSAVKKLAPAVDPGRGFLAVDSSEADGLEIWGQLAPAWHRDEPLGGGGYSGHLVVATTGPGVLEVSLGFITLWIYERGEIFEPESWVSTASILARAFPTSLGDWRSLVLLWLTRRVARGGHGGTIVVVDTDNPACIELRGDRRFEPPLRKLRGAYDAYDDLRRQELQALIGESQVAPSLARDRLKTVNRLTRQLDAVADLASVDGAVIVAREDLAVVCFGAMLQSTAKPAVLRADPNERELRETQIEDLGGARHQSTARWCHGASGFAIVISQDGVASFVRQVGDVVVVLRPLQLGQGDEGVLGDVAPYPEPQDPSELLDYAPRRAG